MAPAAKGKGPDQEVPNGNIKGPEQIMLLRGRLESKSAKSKIDIRIPNRDKLREGTKLSGCMKADTGNDSPHHNMPRDNDEGPGPTALSTGSENSNQVTPKANKIKSAQAVC